MNDCRLFVYQLVGDGGTAGEDVKVGGKPGLDGDDVATHEGHGVDIGSKLEGKEVRNHICVVSLVQSFRFLHVLLLQILHSLIQR